MRPPKQSETSGPTRLDVVREHEAARRHTLLTAKVYLLGASRSEPRLYCRSNAANLLSERSGSNMGSYLIIRESPPFVRLSEGFCNALHNWQREHRHRF